MSSCTSLDHCYPQNAPDRKTVPGTPCHCGRRYWPGAPPRKQLRRLKAGATVVVAGAVHEGTRTVVKHLRDGDDCYVLDAAVYGRKYFERSELNEVAR